MNLDEPWINFIEYRSSLFNRNKIDIDFEPDYKYSSYLRERL